jgi:hypothetical protein
MDSKREIQGIEKKVQAKPRGKLDRDTPWNRK